MDTNMDKVTESAPESHAAAATADLSSNKLITYGTYAACGFIAGFIFKYFGRAIITTIIISAILLAILSYLNFITINCENIKIFFGVTDNCTIASIAKSYLSYIQSHIYEALAVAVGFLLGWTYT